jgi:uncharacterized protein
MSPISTESSRLPALIDPIQLAERGARLDGELALKAMPRLAAGCASDQGHVQVALVFECSEKRDLYRMVGRITARLSVSCQRCLEPMALTLMVTPHVQFARVGDRVAGAEDEEVIEVVKPLSLAELLEDELLLAMPMVPMHELAECPARERVASAAHTGHPFAALKTKPVMK